MNRIIKKITSVVLIFIMAISCFGCSDKVGIQAEKRDIQRGDVKYEDMTFIEFDSTKINEIMDSLNEALENGADKNHVKDLFVMLMDESSKLDDSYLNLMVEYYTDTSNNEKFEAYSKADAEMTFISDDIFVVVSRMLNSEYEDIAAELIDSKYIERLKDYEGITEEQIPLYEKISQLQSRYNEYYSGNVQIEVELNGKIFTWDNINNYEGFDDYSEFVDVYYALIREENNLMGEILLEQVAVRNEIARSEGYDNYYEMAWKEGYYREYSYEAFERIASYIKEYLCDDINELEEMRYSDYSACSDCDFDMSVFYDNLLASGKLKNNAKEAVEYINNYELMMLVDENDYNVGFSTKFETYEEPFIYAMQQEGEYGLDSLLTVAHETGHAINFYYDYSNCINNVFQDLEVAEVQSTSFPLLYMDAISDMYPEYKDVICRRIVGDAVSTLQNCGFQAEVEYLMYTNEDLTVEEMNKLTGKLAQEYKFYNIIVDRECIFWSSIPHYSDSPGYVVSYVMSMMGSLCMWQKAQEGNGDILDIYDVLLTENTANINYKELTVKYKLDEIYEENFYKLLKKSIEKTA